MNGKKKGQLTDPINAKIVPIMCGRDEPLAMERSMAHERRIMGDEGSRSFTCLPDS